ncbi:MAG: XrtA/PEP-CTERM system histidine kinase PrsK [Croceibacterium sp.]
MIAFWSLLIGISYLLCAGFSLALGGWILSRTSARGAAATAEASALVLTSCWALAHLGLGEASIATLALLSLTQLAWLWTLYRLFAYDARDKSVGLVRPVVLALAFVELMQLALLAAHFEYAQSAATIATIANFGLTFRLLFCVGALVLVHNLYAGASQIARQALGWPAAALAVMWLYDLNLATIAYLGDGPSDLFEMLRGPAMVLVGVMLAIGALRHNSNLKFGPSRSFAFQSASLIVIGAYLGGMLLVSQGLAYVGGDLARVMQAAFLALAGALAVAVLPSRRLRGWLRVTLTKHLFQHRYDYRAEWLRFTGTMGRAGPSTTSLGERIVQAVADITDSQAGCLLTARDDGSLTLEACWQWSDLYVPGEALSPAGAQYFEQSEFIVDLDTIRREPANGVPANVVPDWLMHELSAWAMVPLLHYDRLVGIVLLTRPVVARRLDWEDFDLLRVVGRQLASYLAEQSSQDALSEAQRFDEFNRRIAFVMHDIKNLASQLSLLASNAEKHADKPEFRVDMLVTLRNSADKLQGLLSRLDRYGAHGRDVLQPVALDQVAHRVAARYKGQHDVIVIDRPGCVAQAEPENLEQALVHLVQNAIEASAPKSPVFIDLRTEYSQAVIEVTDSGTGMSPEFVRNQLFKPFHSSKQGGFGIGAFEARELVRAMDGRLEVESRVDLGTRFVLRLKLAAPDAVAQFIQTRGTGKS